MGRVLLHLAVAWCLCGTAAAQAATIGTDLPCYLEDRRVELAGAGFAPGAAYTVSRDGTAIGGGTVAADGSVAGSFSSGKLAAGLAERSFELAVGDGTTTATTRFYVSAFRALFSPARGDPARLRVRFSVFGFGTPKLPVFLHYVRPDGKVARTVRLGTTSGPCGKLARTRLRRLFPFRAAAGKWRLQFDTRRSFRAAAVPRIVRAVTVRATRR